jgi:hypothetical protein
MVGKVFELLPAAVGRASLLGVPSDGDRGDRVWVSMHSIGRYGGGPSIRSSCGSQKKPSVGAFLRIYCLATSLAIHDPAIVNIAHVMLGNSLATTERFYNLAQTLETGRNGQPRADITSGPLASQGFVIGKGLWSCEPRL